MLGAGFCRDTHTGDKLSLPFCQPLLYRSRTEIIRPAVSIFIPILPALIVPVQNRNYTAGRFHLHSNGRTLYINCGVGHSLLKARFNARPEVTVFMLHQRRDE